MDAELTNIGKKVISKLTLQNGVSINTVIGIKEGTKLFTRLCKKDTIDFGIYFGEQWDSGIKIVFEYKDNKLYYIGTGAFGWRDEMYNTSENNNILNGIIKSIEDLDIINSTLE